MKYIKRFGLGFSLLLSMAIMFTLPRISSAAVLYSQDITLEPSWNIVSTPKVLDSFSLSAANNSTNFDIYALNPSSPSGWSTLAELGQTKFTPLYGYFINNKTGVNQTLTFNYLADTSPNERLFERTFPAAGWYSLGIANPSYAKSVGASTSDTNNPNNILNSLLGSVSNYGTVIDFTNAAFLSNKNSVALSDPWKAVERSADTTNTSEINSLNDFRETKAYAVYIKQSGTLYNGFQNNNSPDTTKTINSLQIAGTSGTINESNKTITVAMSPHTDLSSLAPIITFTGVSLSPNSGVVQDFTIPVVYTVTAEDGSTQTYTVNVTNIIPSIIVVVNDATTTITTTDDGTPNNDVATFTWDLDITASGDDIYINRDFSNILPTSTADDNDLDEYYTIQVSTGATLTGTSGTITDTSDAQEVVGSTGYGDVYNDDSFYKISDNSTESFTITVTGTNQTQAKQVRAFLTGIEFTTDAVTTTTSGVADIQNYTANLSTDSQTPFKSIQ